MTKKISLWNYVNYLYFFSRKCPFPLKKEGFWRFGLSKPTFQNFQKVCKRGWFIHDMKNHSRFSKSDCTHCFCEEIITSFSSKSSTSLKTSWENKHKRKQQNWIPKLVGSYMKSEECFSIFLIQKNFVVFFNVWNIFLIFMQN